MTETSELTRFTNKCSNLLSEGIVGPNIQLAIKDLRTNENLGPNKVGELCVKASAVISGYYKNPTETQRAFDSEGLNRKTNTIQLRINMEYSKNEIFLGWFRSGDEAYYDKNGEIVIVGRMKDIIRYRDTDIHPAHVEDLLLAIPGVAEAAVIGVPHDIDVERPVAFIKRISGSQVNYG